MKDVSTLCITIFFITMFMKGDLKRLIGIMYATIYNYIKYFIQ